MKKIFLAVRWPVGGIRTFINYIYGKWNYEPIELHILVPRVKEIAVLQEQLSNLSCVWHITQSERPTFYEFMKTGTNIIRKNSFSIIHAHGFTAAIAISAVLPFSKSGKVFTAHEMLDNCQFQGVKGKIKRWLITAALNRYDVIHSVSNDAETNLKETLPALGGKKFLVIHSGIDTEKFFCPEPDALRSRMGYSEYITIIGFFGRFMPPKGFRYLIGAMEILEKKYPGKYRVVCFGAGAYIREDQQVIGELGLEDAFYFHDFVPDTAPYIKACDVVAMPSLSEAYGLLAVEALVAGVPLVASACVGLREVCAGSPAIMVSPADAKALATAIESSQFVDKQALADYAVLAARDFSIDVTRNKIRKLYSDLAG